MAEHIVSPRLYYKVFAALAVLTLVTIGAAYLDLGRFNSIVALLIAVSKAVLVVLFFMHVRWEHRLTLVFALGGFCWLAILIVLAYTDYGTRHWFPIPGELAPIYFEDRPLE